jgi:hypothetical protein
VKSREVEESGKVAEQILAEEMTEGEMVGVEESEMMAARG